MTKKPEGRDKAVTGWSKHYMPATGCRHVTASALKEHGPCAQMCYSMQPLHRENLTLSGLQGLRLACVEVAALVGEKERAPVALRLRLPPRRAVGRCTASEGLGVRLRQREDERAC